MKEISEKDLNRLKKRKGVTVKRKPGSQPEKPEPEVNGSQSLSGELPTTEAIPVPAFEFYSIMEKMTSVIDKLTDQDNGKTRPAEEETQETKSEERRKRPFEILKEITDADPSPPAVAVVTPAEPVAEPKEMPDSWDHIYHRDRQGLVTQVVSIDETGNKWTHNFERTQRVLTKIRSISSSGLEFLHQFKRGENALIESATTTKE
jgi:hypothetical protein